MQWISGIFWKCLNSIYSISKKCLEFIASKMLEIKSRHFTWGGPICIINVSSFDDIYILQWVLHLGDYFGDPLYSYGGEFILDT